MLWKRLCPILAFLTVSVVAEEAVQLSDLLITGARTPGSAGTGRSASLGETLDSLGAVRLSSQGIGGQSDLSIRGSSFSGAGLALNGLALRNPQTEHFHSELPLVPDVLGSPDLRTGIGQQALTGAHLVGTVDFSPALVEPGGRLALGLGEFSAWSSTAYAARTVSVEQGTLGLAAFAGSEAAAGDPWRDNDLRRSLGGLHLQFRAADWRVDVLGGHSDKTFGARGYYGAPASLPSEETLRDSLLLASAQTGNLDAEYTRFAFAWRELRDSYLLDASRPALYRNRHHSRLLTLAFDRRLELNESWALLGRVELEREDLDSVYEGTVPASGLGEHWRARAGALVMPEYRMGDWRLTAGLRATGFTDDRAAWLPAAGIAWTPRPHTEISLGYSETVCLPSYTELNYNSPSSLGNAGLERRHARSLELKAAAPVADRHRVEAVAFARRESETVDWIRTAPGVPWHAANLDSLDVLGLELELETEITPSLLIEVGAQLLRKRTADEPYAGRYALDYPGESARLAVIWHAAPWCELRAEQRVDRWSRNPERDTDRTAWLGAVTLAARPPQHPRLSAAIGLENVWDVAHQPVLGVEAPGRQLRTSLTYDW